jgi:ribosome-associated protein
MTKNVLDILNTLAQALYDKKGFNILTLDVRGCSTMTDYYIIAEGNVDRHVRALSQAIRAALSSIGLHPYHVDGEKTGDWIVLDCGDIVIHIFQHKLQFFP